MWHEMNAQDDRGRTARGPGPWAGACAALALLAAGCSQPEAAGGPRTSPERSPSAMSGPTSDPTSASARGDCRLPEGARTQGPVDDVIGLRPGMPLAEVDAFLRCRDPAYKWMRMQSTLTVGPGRLIPAKVLRAINRQEDIVIRFVGAPGAEQAVYIERSLNFGGPDQPDLAQLKQTVFNKYGPFQSAFRNTEALEYGDQSRGSLVYLASGETAARAGKAFWTCSNASNVHEDMTLHSECALTVNYLIGFRGPVNSLTVAVYDFRVLAQAAEAYEAAQRETGAAGAADLDL